MGSDKNRGIYTAMHDVWLRSMSVRPFAAFAEVITIGEGSLIAAFTEEDHRSFIACSSRSSLSDRHVCRRGSSLTRRPFAKRFPEKFAIRSSPRFTKGCPLLSPCFAKGCPLLSPRFAEGRPLLSLACWTFVAIARLIEGIARSPTPRNRKARREQNTAQKSAEDLAIFSSQQDAP